MTCKHLAALALIVTTCSAEVSSAPPRMLRQVHAVADSAAASGSRTSFAILRLPDGSFAFYDRNNPRGGALTLPDHEGGTYTLLPSLPDDIANSEVVAASGVLANTQVILTPDGQLVSVFVQAERFDKETAAKVGLRLYLDVWIKQALALSPPMVTSSYWQAKAKAVEIPS